jgi:O-succinylbenzoic acid--CoA ligase
MEVWLARSARVHGERTALTTRETSLSYSALYEHARVIGGGLRERGVGPGDRVALALASEQLVLAVHACMLIGAAAVPIDLRLGTQERSDRIRGSALVLDELITGAPIEPTERWPEDTATVMFTSGTIAVPKEVRLSYENWLWNALGSALALGLDLDERWLCPMPLAHVGGLSIQIRSAIYGTSVLLHERFDTGAALAALMDPGERVTLVSLVPTMLARLLDAGLENPPSLRWALLGGGPIAPSLLERAAAAGVPVAPSYGMTEACSQIATHGWPLLGVELRIGPDGEVLVRGRTVAASALAADGWLHSGDLGAVDEQGRLTIAGRLADTIVTGGENVAPTEVEAVLQDHPAVADAAVFGRPDEEWGEAVTASVVIRAGSSADADELRRYCAARLAAFKVPKQVLVVDALPRGVTGKLLRRELV